MIFQGGHFGGSRPGDQILSDTPVGQTLRKKGKVSILSHFSLFVGYFVLFGSLFLLDWTLEVLHCQDEVALIRDITQKGWQGCSLFKNHPPCSNEDEVVLIRDITTREWARGPKRFLLFPSFPSIAIFSPNKQKSQQHQWSNIFVVLDLNLNKKRRRIVSTGVL